MVSICVAILLMCELLGVMLCVFVCFFFFQAEDGIRDLVRSRGLGDVYKRQVFAVDAGFKGFFVYTGDQGILFQKFLVLGLRGPVVLSLIHI